LDLEKIRTEFPVTRKYAYFDNAAVGPLPARTLEAANRVMQEKCEGDLHWMEWEETVEQARKSIGPLIEADPNEIALVHSTTEGLAVVANGLSYEKGSNIITCDMEFQTNLFPWQAIARRQGVELRVVRNHDGKLLMEDFSQVIDRKTRLVAVSYVQFSNGFRIDLEELSKIAHENGAYIVTDAVQAVGQMPVNMSKLGVDFLAASGYKWLISPISTGFLYVRRDLLDQLWPTMVGYRADQDPWVFGFREFSPAASARRYEAGQLNFPGFAGMKQSTELIQSVGTDHIWQRTLALQDRLLNSVRGKAAVEVKSHLDPASRSGILNLACKDPDSVAKRLLEHSIVVSVRSDGLRISPHFYNSEEEIDKLASELSAL